MITQPSMLGYAFNPVTFYLGTDGEQRTTMVVAEVHNRVGQRHIYVLHPYLSDGRSSAEFGKEFYVSPFLKMTGQYRFSMKNGSDCLEFGFDLIQEGKCVLETKLDLIAKPLSDAGLSKAAITHPLIPQKTVAAIYWQALKLKTGGARYRRVPRPHEKRSRV
mgnify:FL=1